MKIEKKLNERNYALDFFKIIATILIVWHHYQQSLEIKFNRINFYYGKFYFGYLVELFFAISGFLMFKYIQKIKDGLKFKEFFVNRIVRILPLVAIAAIIYEIIIYFYSKVFGIYFFNLKPDFWGTIISMIGVQAGWIFKNPMINNPMWYISVLILCYIIFYIITNFSKNYIYIYIIMIFLGITIQEYAIDLAFLNYYTARGYYSFFFGLLLAIFLNNYKLKKIIIISSIINIILITFLIIKHYYIIEKNINYTLTFLYYPAFIIICHSNIIKNIFKLSLCKIIGVIAEISFNVYVWHGGAILILAIINKFYNLNINLNSYKTMIIFTFVLYIFGVTSYYLLEKPLKNILLKFIENFEKIEEK
ncbi:acyltransferase family protein [Fusobacterium polymorphum]